MAYMELTRGFLNGDTIQYPIYDISVPTGANTIVVPISPAGQAGTYIDSCLGVIYTGGGDISSAFPAEMPRTIEQDGCICQNDYHFVSSSPNWIPKTQAFSAVPVGTKPDDWDTHFFDYYTGSVQTLSGNRCSTFDSTINGDANYASPPTWDSTKTYYHDDLPEKQRTTHLFKTDAGFTFGINIAPNYDYRYIRAIAFCNPGTPFQRNYQFSAIHTPEGRAINFGGSPSTDYTAPYQVQGGFFAALPYVQIFVHIVHNDIDYWGPAHVLMSDTSANAHPIGIRLFAMPISYWGTSIHGGAPSQGGNWGDSTTRRGGDGEFSAPSDNRGDSSGAYLTNYETSMRNALNDGFNNGGVKIYQIAGQYAGDVIGVLFGADYFDKFLNSMYNPLSAILSYHMIPSSLRGDAFANNIPLTAGGFDISAHMTTPINFPQINSVKKLHVGSVDIANYFGAYPDFAPHTQAILHLPYIGDITIDINAIMYGTLSVDYFCDNVSGNVAAWIWCSDRDGKCTYKYIVTGNCAYTIPLYSQSQNGGAVGKIMSSGVSLVGGLLSGNAAGAVGGALGIAGGLFDAATTPRNTQTTGGNSGNVSMLGDSVVWLEIIRPQWVNPENYQSQSGIPSQISGKISDFRGGFFQIETVDLENLPATDSEIAELEQMLKDGIYYLNE